MYLRYFLPIDQSDQPSRQWNGNLSAEWSELINATLTQRSMTSKSLMPTAPSCIDNSWRSTTLPAADTVTSDQTLPFGNEHQWVLENKSDNWIVRCYKFSSDVFISIKILFFMQIRIIHIISKECMWINVKKWTILWIMSPKKFPFTSRYPNRPVLGANNPIRSQNSSPNTC